MQMWHKEQCGLALPQRFAILIAVGFVTSLIASAQSVEGPYQPLTPSQSLGWFVTSTISPSHMAGVAVLSAGGTAVNRPEEYGTHWRGLADRFGIGMAGSAVGNTIEVAAGRALREDPRYFRAPQQPIKARVGNVVRLTFLARGENGGFGPAYARYIAIAGSNFLSNAWRVRSEANTRAALLRASEGFAGRIAANGFAEFWPDVKKYVFHARHRAAQYRPDASEVREFTKDSRSKLPVL